MAKKKTARIGNISGIDLLKHSRPRAGYPLPDRVEQDEERQSKEEIETKRCGNHP